MKRAVWVAAVSLVLILLLFFFCDLVRRGVAHDMLRRCRQVEEYVAWGNAQEAKQLAMEMQALWQDKEAFLTFFTHHQLTAQVNRMITQVIIALDAGRDYELRMGLEGLREAVRQVHEQDAFVLKNIL
ncbi:MAG: DUF4363 family protein [Clostridia bacterium]|nr:DUF4363 family protein [Clostridia bacterium]